MNGWHWGGVFSRVGGFVELTLISVVAAHLLAVNMAGAGPLVLSWLDWIGHRRQRPELQQAAVRLGWWSIAAAVIGVASVWGRWRSCSFGRRERMPSIGG